MNKAAFYGGDMTGVTLILHVEAPIALTDYLQSTGQGGRDGQPCLSLVIALSERQTLDANSSDTFSGKKSMQQVLVEENLCIRFVHGKFFDGKGENCMELAASEPDIFLCEQCAHKSKDPNQLQGFFTGK
jgi:superfamily II DNA helicase RecQ